MSGNIEGFAGELCIAGFTGNEVHECRHLFGRLTGLQSHPSGTTGNARAGVSAARVRDGCPVKVVTHFFVQVVDLPASSQDHHDIAVDELIDR